MPENAFNLAMDAANCDSMNPDRIELDAYLCFEVEQSIDRVKANEIMSLATTPMGLDDIRTIEHASSILYYRCEL